MHLAHGLASGQVLQRLGKKGATARLSGTIAPAVSAPVTATLASKGKVLPGWKARAVGKAAKGKFEAVLKDVPVGGPYRLELAVGKESLVVPAFFVGDVWLLAGQSNMEGVGNREWAAKPHPLIQAFSMRREWRAAEEPLHLIPESPDASHVAVQVSRAEGERLRRAAKKGVGPGLHFAREMVKRTGVPQGLVCTAHGGTSMLQWDPAKKNEGGKSLYGSFLLSARATGQPFAGVLWYQGESDASVEHSPLYADRMKKLVAASRRDLKQPKLPWCVVQLARFIETMTPERDAAWNRIQEEQRLLPERIAHLETVAAIDLPLDDPIHVGGDGMARLGIRLARAADRLALGNRKEARPPRLKAVGKPYIPKGAAGPVIDVTFDDVVGGLRADGEPWGFTFVDAEGRARSDIYRVSLHGNTARLHLRGNPVSGSRLAYGLGSSPRCTLTDARDLALPVFGARHFAKPAADLPFVVRWRKSPVVPVSAPFGKIPLPDMESLGTELKDVSDSWLPGFVNDHPAWEGKSGYAHFAAEIDLPETMRLEMLAGYDGPFRLWLDGKPFFAALDGTNPCFPDEGKKKFRLGKGRHRLHVAMDINKGRAWGFFLRFRRLDVTAAQIASGDYAKPTYSA